MEYQRMISQDLQLISSFRQMMLIALQNDWQEIMQSKGLEL
jgi:hypothetical protein